MLSEFKLIRCEASLEALKDCGLFSKISLEKQNALLVYNNLKTYCSDLGHTYIDMAKLEHKMTKIKMDLGSIWEPVHFLCCNKVLKLENKKVALKNLYLYELQIASCLTKLMTREPWRISLDVKKVLYSALRSKTNNEDGSEESSDLDEPMDEPEASFELDPDQVKAAEMMCDNVVTLISGKGGCGKTTVVSCIFKAAMKLQQKTGDCDTCEGDEEKKPIEVLLSAPTGRAAALLSKNTGFKSYTMHQVREKCGLILI